MFWQTVGELKTIIEKLFIMIDNMRQINVLFRKKIFLIKVKLKLAKLAKFPSHHHQQYNRAELSLEHYQQYFRHLSFCDKNCVRYFRHLKKTFNFN